MDKLNKKMLADGILPRKTKFETQKDFLRSAIEETAASSHSLEEFQKLLKEKYLISFKTSRGRFSYLHPERGKYITGRSLGSHYEKEYLFSQWEKKAMQKQALFPEQKSSEDTSWNSMQNNLPAFVFIKSNLKLVVDLQNCVKAQQSSAYARKVKLSNLQQMAKTVAYIQEHGYDTEEDLEKNCQYAQSSPFHRRQAEASQRSDPLHRTILGE